MTTDERFETLWTEFLEGDLPPEGMAELQTLLDANKHIRKSATDLLGYVMQDKDASCGSRSRRNTKAWR